MFGQHLLRGSIRSRRPATRRPLLDPFRPRHAAAAAGARRRCRWPAPACFRPRQQHFPPPLAAQQRVENLRSQRRAVTFPSRQQYRGHLLAGRSAPGRRPPRFAARPPIAAPAARRASAMSAVALARRVRPNRRTARSRSSSLGLARWHNAERANANISASSLSGSYFSHGVPLRASASSKPASAVNCQAAYLPRRRGRCVCSAAASVSSSSNVWPGRPAAPAFRAGGALPGSASSTAVTSRADCRASPS